MEGLAQRREGQASASSAPAGDPTITSNNGDLATPLKGEAGGRKTKKQQSMISSPSRLVNTSPNRRIISSIPPDAASPSRGDSRLEQALLEDLVKELLPGTQLGPFHSPPRHHLRNPAASIKNQPSASSQPISSTASSSVAAAASAASAASITSNNSHQEADNTKSALTRPRNSAAAIDLSSPLPRRTSRITFSLPSTNHQTAEPTKENDTNPSSFPSELVYSLSTGQPLSTLDLSGWAPQLSHLPTLNQIAKENPTFTHLILHGPNLSIDGSHVKLWSTTWSSLGVSLLDCDLSYCQFLPNIAIKHLIQAFPSLKTLCLKGCSMLTDKALQNLAHYSPLPTSALRRLDVSDCPSITSVGITAMTTKCKHLVHMSLAGCHQVTDRGLIALGEQLNLETLDISRCNALTSNGLASFVVHCKRLLILKVAHNPHFNDESMKPMLETEVVYGMKRCAGCRALQVLDVEGCTGLTSFVTAYWLGGVDGLKELNIRGCSEILSFKGTSNLGQLSSLTKLNLSHNSPITTKSLTEWLNSPSPPAPLVWLDLSSSGHLTDQGIDLLTKAYPKLQYLSLQNTPRLTDIAIRYIAERCPALETLLLNGCPLITNHSVAAMTITHKGIKHLNLSHCTRLTDEALASISDLPGLISLDISSCRHVSDHGISMLDASTLSTLKAGGLPLLTDQGLQAMATRLPGLTDVDLSGSTHVTGPGVELLLTGCANLISLNVHDCPAIDPSTWSSSSSVTAAASSSSSAILPSSQRGHPTHTISNHLVPTTDPSLSFTGLRVNNLALRDRDRTLTRLANQRQAASLIKHWWKEAIALKKARLTRALVMRRRKVAATLIQSIVRMHWVLKRLRILRRAWNGYVNRLRQRLSAIWFERAKGFWKKKQLRQAFRTLREYKKAKKKQKSRGDRTAAAVNIFRRVHLTKYLKAWRKATDQEVVVHIKEEAADQLFYDSIGPRLFTRWAVITKGRAKLRHRVRNVFLNCVDCCAYNSTRHLHQVHVADAYRNMMVLAPTWMAMKRDFESSPYHAKKARALTYLREVTQTRLTQTLLRAWAGYLAYRQQKVRNERMAEKHWREAAKTTALYKLWEGGRLRRHFVKKRSVKQQQALRKLNHCREDRQAKHVWDDHVRDQLTYFVTTVWQDRFMYCLALNRDYRAYRRSLYAKAKGHYVTTLRSKIFEAWHHHQEAQRRRLLMICKMGDEKLVARIYHQMIANIADMKQERLEAEAAAAEAKRLAEEAARKAEEERLMMKKMEKAATRIQARWRGVSAKKKAKSWRVFRDWAVLKVQQQVRVWKGRKEAYRRRRHRALAWTIREEKERQLMAVVDLESWLFRKEIEAAALINRFARGLLARGRVFRLKQARAKKEGYVINVIRREEALLVMAERRRVRALEVARREKACLSVQCVYRGYCGRQLVKKMRFQLKLNRLVVVMQCIYRQHLAVRKAAASRRWKANWEFVRKTRATQGYILRMFGFRNRLEQRRLVDFLGRLGMDLRHYQLDMVKQFQEMKEDLHLAFQEMRLDRDALLKNRISNMKELSKWREDHYHEYLPVPVIENRDTVRIIIKGHELFGFTGMIIRIDREIPDKPIVEMKMDHNGAIVYLPFHQEKSNKLLSVSLTDSMTKPPMDAAKVQTNAENIIAWAEQEAARWRPIAAALKIQKAYRRHIARRYVASLRYTYWNHLRRKRLAILQFLESIGGFTSRNLYMFEYHHFFNRLELPKAPPTAWWPQEAAERIQLHRYRTYVQREFEERLKARKVYIHSKFRRSVGTTAALPPPPPPSTATGAILVASPRKQQQQDLQQQSYQAREDISSTRSFAGSPRRQQQGQYNPGDDLVSARPNFFGSPRQQQQQQQQPYQQARGEDISTVRSFAGSPRSVRSNFSSPRLEAMSSAASFFLSPRGGEITTTRLQQQQAYMLQQQQRQGVKEIGESLSTTNMRVVISKNAARAEMMEVLDFYRVFTPTAKFWQEMPEAWATFLTLGDWDKPGCLGDLGRIVIGGKKGSRRRLTAKQRQTWIAHYQFKQFLGSPHIRADGHAMYHGMWSKLPIDRHLALLSNKQSSRISISKLNKMNFYPQGDGLAQFFNCWEVAKEERTLSILVKSARDLLEPVDTIPNIYAVIECNRKKFKTKAHQSVMPFWNSKFQIDVTSPEAVLSVAVYDSDGYLYHDFLGTVKIVVGELPYKKRVAKWYKLETGRGVGDQGGQAAAVAEGDGSATAATAGGEKKAGSVMKSKNEKNLGEVELELMWEERVEADDVLETALCTKAATILQAWWRVVLGQRLVAEKRLEAKEHERVVHAASVLLQGVARILKAKENLRKIKLRKKIRRKFRRAYRRYRILRTMTRDIMLHRRARLIQNLYRRWRARRVYQQLRAAYQAMIHRSTACIQKFIRRHLACTITNRLRLEAMEAKTYVPVADLLPVSEWLPTYGTQPGFPTKRLARICRRVTKNILIQREGIVLTCFGPAEGSVWFASDEDDEGAATANRNEEEQQLVEVKLRMHRVYPRMTMKEVAELRDSSPLYPATLQFTSAFNTLGTVLLRVLRIQCRFHINQARQVLLNLRHRKNAARTIQRFFRNQGVKYIDAANRIQRMIRGFLAHRQLLFKRKEVACAIMLQCVFRSYQAFRVLERKRWIPDVQVIACSSRLDEKFKAMNTVDGRVDTMWVSKQGKRYAQFITYDLGQPLNLSKITLLSAGDTSTPKTTAILYAHEPKGPFTQLTEFEVHPTKQPQAFRLPINADATARYWQLRFQDNHGSSAGMSLLWVTFLPRQEQKPAVIQHPECILLTPGPPLGEKAEVVLRCSAVGWPLPAYQWQKNGVDIPGANGPDLKLEICAPVNNEEEGYKTYRCFHCRRICSKLSKRWYRLICKNCGTPYDYPEYTDRLAAREKADADTTEVMMKLEMLKKKHQEVVGKYEKLQQQLHDLALQQAETVSAAGLRKEKYELLTRIRLAEAAIKKAADEVAAQEVLIAELFQHRLTVEDPLDPAKLPYENQGIYQCVVHNKYLNGTFRAQQISRRAVVYASLPEPVKVRVWSAYRPQRPRRRMQWEKYHTICGQFLEGRVEGDVVIKYKQGESYEGPYVEETWLDSMGRVMPQGRQAGHWGAWKTADGWIYEGRHVDNHFDVNRKQGGMRCRAPNGDVYEGFYLDNERHGMGEMRYADGSCYMGEWYRGQRQGMGVFRTLDGSKFEGEWDHDVIHGEGEWRWRDGGSYVGEFLEGKRHGKGTYATPHYDVYEGDFVANRMEGEGIFRFRDGSVYVGAFADNSRHGPGTHTTKNGTKFVGTFKEDQQHGVCKVYRPIPREPGDPFEWGYETQTGEWCDGKFVQWVDIPLNPKTTYYFVQQFEANEEEYDGVMALILAKNLPFLPPGVYPKDPSVLRVLKRIRSEAGELCGYDTIRKNSKKLEELVPVLESVKEKHDVEVGKLMSRKAALEAKEVLYNEAKKKAVDGRAKANTLALHQEQYWANDLTGSRDDFLACIQKLSTVTTTDWATLRKHETPPAIVLKVLSCVAMFFKLPENDWKTAKFLIGDSNLNAAVDELALIEGYDFKLIHLLRNYQVFDYTKEEEMLQKIEDVIKHPRFTSDNLAVLNFGMGLAYLVDFCKATYTYIKKSEGIYDVYQDFLKAKQAADVLDYEVNHLSTDLELLQQDYSIHQKTELEVRTKRVALESEVDSCQKLVNGCERIIQKYKAPPKGPKDYYERKMDLEAKQVRLKLESVMEAIRMEVEKRAVEWKRINKEKQTAMLVRFTEEGGGLSTTAGDGGEGRDGEGVLSTSIIETGASSSLQDKRIVIVDATKNSNKQAKNGGKGGKDEEGEKALDFRLFIQTQLPHFRADLAGWLEEQQAAEAAAVEGGAAAEEDRRDSEGAGEAEENSIATASIASSAAASAAPGSMSPEMKAAFEKKRGELVQEIYDYALTEINQQLHEVEGNETWVTLNGQVLRGSFLLTLIKTAWAEADYDDYVKFALEKWEEVFGTEAALMAIQARISPMFTAETKEQGEIWAKYHATEIEEEEEKQMHAFEELYPLDTGKAVLQTLSTSSENGGGGQMVPLAVKSQADTWARYHPDAIRATKEDIEREQANLFEKQFKKETVQKFLTIQKQRHLFPPAVVTAASSWAKAHVAEIAEEEQKQMKAAAEAFTEDFPYDTAPKAVEIIQRLGPDAQTEERREQARAWLALHPQEARQAKKMVESHISRLVKDQAKHVKGLQIDRKTLLNKLEEMKERRKVKREENKEEQQGADDLWKDIEEALISIEEQLLGARREQIIYLEGRIQEASLRLREVASDKSYLDISDNVRPSEREGILLDQKARFERKCRKLKEEIKLHEKVLIKAQEEIDSILKEGRVGASKQQQQQLQGESGEGEWKMLYDEVNQAYYYQHAVTGEVQWA